MSESTLMCSQLVLLCQCLVDRNIVKISRQEFIELMEAAMDNRWLAGQWTGPMSCICAVFDSVTDDAERHNALLVSQLEQLKLQVSSGAVCSVQWCR